MKKTSKSILTLLFITLMTILFATCEKDEPEKDPNTEYMEYTKGEGEIGQAGGEITVDDPDSEIYRASIEIPEGAIESTTDISIGLGDISSKVNLSNEALSVNLLPHGQTFNEPVIITLPFNQKIDADSLQVWYFNDNDSSLNDIDILSIDNDEKNVSFQTDHFSSYVITKKSISLKVSQFIRDDLLLVKVIMLNNLSEIELDPISDKILYGNAYDIINNESYLDYIYSVEVIDKSTNERVGQKQTICYRINAYNRKYALRVIKADKEIINELPQKEFVRAVEFARGYPVLFDFDITNLSQEKEFYFKISWKLDEHTVKYFLNSKKQAFCLSELSEYDNDINNNLIVDQWDESPLTDEIKITEPNNTTEWILGENVTVNWETNWFSEEIDIGLYLNDKLKYIISSGTDNDGSYSFILPDNLSEGNGYHVEIIIDGELIAESSTFSIVKAGSKPITAFIANNTTITQGQSVQFTDQSTNEPTSWSWDFGDGNTSSLQNPSHTYTSEGTYSVSLTAKNAYGQDTESKTNYITAEASGSKPVAAFIANSTTINEGQSVQFTNQSTNAPTSWSWDFGDGNTSTSQNPSHTYINTGNYDVKLTVSNQYGSDNEIKYDYISVQAATSAEPDLIIEEITMSPLNPAVSQDITFTVVAKNTGQGSSTACKLSISVGGESEPAMYNIPALSTNETYTVTRIENLDIANNYRTTATIDVDQEVAESNETNNEKYIEYTVTEEGDELGELIFNPNLTYGTLADVDGNTYKTIQIGEQVWMAQNLATTKYNDGTAIPTRIPNFYSSTPVYCWYDDDSITYKNTYGALYNWYTVETGKLCPTGWHVPTDDEWKKLEMTLGMSLAETDTFGYRGTDEGSKLAGGSKLWPINKLTNNEEFGSSGFAALPGGYREGGSSRNFYYDCYFWISTENSTYPHLVWRRVIGYKYSSFCRIGNGKKDWGYSVRCVR